MDPDDDPTRALDEFVRRMRPGAPPAVAPDLGDLLQRVPPPAPEPPAARHTSPRAGARWATDDVTDVPSIDLPPVDGAPPDPVQVDAALAQASRVAAAGAAAAAKPWQPDIDQVLEKRARNPRLLAAWQSGCWVGAVREVFEASTEIVQTSTGPVVETYPPHRLLLAWAPRDAGGPQLGRWPDQVRLCAVPRDAAAEVLLAQLPDDTSLWIDAALDIDWALAAEIVLHHEATLRPFQIDALRRFIDAEREAGFARLNKTYEQRMPGAAVTRRDAA